MAYTWTEDLNTGNETIDTQHKKWIAALNDLMAACSGGKGQDQINATMRFLSDYTAKHFADEENLQQKYSYPDYPNHKQMHAAFKSTMADIAKQLQTEGATTAVVVKLSSSLGTWLINHIKTQDKKIAAHIRSK